MTLGTAISAIELTKTLGEGASRHRVIGGLDLAIREGQLTLLMGPSGSGKSTLLSLLGLMQRPDEGDVVVQGISTARLSARQLATVRRSHIGYVFQSFNLFPGLTALQNVQLGLAVRGAAGRGMSDEATDALAAVGLGGKTGSKPRELSGGQQQRVAIARAIVGDTSILLADEPTAALDSENGIMIMQTLHDLAHQAGRAVVVVTHDPRAAPFADRMLELSDGRICSDTARWSPVNGVPHDIGRAAYVN